MPPPEESLPTPATPPSISRPGKCTARNQVCLPTTSGKPTGLAYIPVRCELDQELPTGTVVPYDITVQSALPDTAEGGLQCRASRGDVTPVLQGSLDTEIDCDFVPGEL